MPGERHWRLNLAGGASLVGFRREGEDRRTGVFVHGFRSHCDGAKSRSLSRWAGRHDHAWLRFDQRGCGLSGSDFRRFALTGAIDDLHRVLDALGEPPCLLVGSSLGALIAVHVAASGRHHVEGLLLLAPALRFTDRFIHGHLDTRDLDRWRSRGYRWFPDLYEGGCYRLDYSFCADALCYGAPPGELPCPVRVIHGGRDELLPVGDTKDWLETLRCPSRAGGKVLEIVPEGDHRLTGWTDVIARQIETLWETLWKEVSKPCA